MQTPTEGGSSDELRLEHYREGDEEDIVALLATCFPDTWGQADLDHWRWKHLQRPGFDPQDILVARLGSRVVGCFHRSVLPLRIAPGITVSASYDGDYAVLPETRGNDLTGKAFALTDPELARRGVALRGGFTSKALNERHYGKKYGYVFVPTATARFRKFISLDPLRAKVEELGQRALDRPWLRKCLARCPLTVGLAIEGLPEAVLNCSNQGFTLTERPAQTAPVSIDLPYRVLTALPDGAGSFARQFLRAILSREARVRGVPVALLRGLQFMLAAVLPTRHAGK